MSTPMAEPLATRAAARLKSFATWAVLNNLPECNPHHTFLGHWQTGTVQSSRSKSTYTSLLDALSRQASCSSACRAAYHLFLPHRSRCNYRHQFTKAHCDGQVAFVIPNVKAPGGTNQVPVPSWLFLAAWIAIASMLFRDFTRRSSPRDTKQSIRPAVKEWRLR